MTTKSKKPSISVFFPCYNDENTIAKLIDDAVYELKKLTNDYEIIVIDDGSKDNSRNILKKLSSQLPYVRLVLHKKNRGYGGALKSGFQTASKDLVFYTDGDGQYDVHEMPILYQLMSDDINFVNGFKMKRQDAFHRVLLGNMYSRFVRLLFLLPVYDVDCDFRLIRKSLIKKLELKSNSGSICTELVKKAQRQGAVFRQVSIHHYERRFGRSQFFRLNRLLATFRELARLWWQLMVVDKLIKA